MKKHTLGLLFILSFSLIVLSSCLKKITIRFIDYDGTVLKEEEIKKKGEISSPSVPNREGYTFKGWSINFDNLTESTDIHAQYEINKYTVVFKNYDGTLLSQQIIEYGQTIMAPISPTREGYTFTKWNNDIPIKVTSNLEFTAEYVEKIYTVVFKDHDGTVLKTEEVNHGSDVVAPVSPTRSGYTFTGWDKAFTNVTSDLEINAVYEINKYNVVFKDHDGTVLKTEEVNHGSDATAPVSPTRPGFTFTGWDKAFTNVTSDLEINAAYTAVYYNITYNSNLTSYEYTSWASKDAFLNELYGDLLAWFLSRDSYHDSTVTKSGNTITFKYTDSAAKTQTVTVSDVASFRATDIYAAEDSWGHYMYKPFTRVNDDEIIFEEDSNYFFQTEPYRTKYRALDQYFYNCIKTSYSSYSTGYKLSGTRVQIFFRFHQWNKGTNIAAFNTLPKKLVSTTNTSDITLPISPVVYHSGEEVVLPNPISESLTFLGWYLNPLGAGTRITNIPIGSTGDFVLYALWDSDLTNYTITFLDWDQKTVILSSKITTNTITPPIPPVHVGYDFIGWDKDYQNIISDIVLTAQYEKHIYTVQYNNNISDVEVTYDDTLPTTFTVDSTLPIPNATAPNYLFLGWYENELGTGAKIDKTGSKDLVLYAKWFAKPSEGSPVSTGEYAVVSDETNIPLGYSAHAFLKNGTTYIDSKNITYASFNPEIVSIDNTGFMKAHSVGTTVILLLDGNNYASMTVTVTDEPLDVLYVGHQGSGGPVVQNAASAFEEGGKRGYYALECDVRVSADGVYYICHDDVFKSTLFTDSTLFDKTMASYTWAKLKDLQIKDTYNGVTYYETLCTVEDYLLICKKYGVKALLELKWTTGINSNDNSKLGGLVSLVKKCGMYENAIFMTSMKNCLNYLKTNYPDASLQFLSGSSTTTEDNFVWCINNHIALDAPNNVVTAAIVKRFHDNYLFVNAYTVDSASVANNLVAMGVDMITTNNLGV